jgi:hypothetical protein
MKVKARYVLIIEAEHRADDPNGMRRLRLLLKRALRAFGLRCIEVKPVDETKQERDATRCHVSPR